MAHLLDRLRQIPPRRIAKWAGPAVALLILLFADLNPDNPATAQVMLPILAAVAVKIGVHPLLLMVPATISASCAFMMPIATPPNAIVFATERIRIKEMARAGVLINIGGALLITAAVMLFKGMLIP